MRSRDTAPSTPEGPSPTPPRAGSKWLRTGAAITLATPLLLECTARVYLFGPAGLHPIRVDSVRPIFQTDLLRPSPFSQEYQKIESFLRDSGIEVLDLTPAFAGEREPHRLWVALDDAHPNAEAHRRIAEASADFVARPAREEANRR